MSEIGARVRASMVERLPQIRQVDLAEAVQMTPDAFSRSLSGQRQFAAIELARLARVLRVSMHWLVTGETDPSQVLVAARHVYDQDTQQHVINWDTQVEGLKSIATAFSQVFREAAERQLPELPSDAGIARERLIASCGSDFVRRFSESVELAFGIEVVRVGGISGGYSLTVVGHRVIAIEPTQNWFFQNWTIAHELGHFCAEQQSDLENIASVSGHAEAAANAFAAELLLPAAEMRSIDWSTIAPVDIAQKLWGWGVSTAALRSRLVSLQIIPGEAVRELLMLSTQRLLRHHLPRQSATDEISDRMERAGTRRFPEGLLAAHSSAVANSELGPEYLAWMLDVAPAQLESDFVADDVDFDSLAMDLGLVNRNDA